MSSLGERIKKLRLECQWTQDELAHKINAKKQVISNWERNTAKPDIKNLTALAEVFRVSTDYLLGMDVAPQFVHPQGGVNKFRNRHWDWVIQESYDLLDVLNSGYRFKLRGRQLEKEDLEIIANSVSFLFSNVIRPIKEKCNTEMDE